MPPLVASRSPRMWTSSKRYALSSVCANASASRVPLVRSLGNPYAFTPTASALFISRPPCWHRLDPAHGARRSVHEPEEKQANGVHVTRLGPSGRHRGIPTTEESDRRAGGDGVM